MHLLGPREGALDGVLALTPLTLGYTDAISSALAEGYLEQGRLLVLERDRDRRDLLESLLLGYEEARQALAWAAPRGDVTPLLEMRVSDYLFERADATALRMVPAVAQRLFSSSAASDRILVDTLMAYAAADMAVRLTAARLMVHANTAGYRLGKLHQLLGREPTRFSNLVELLAWARLCANAQTGFESATTPHA